MLGGEDAAEMRKLLFVLVGQAVSSHVRDSNPPTTRRMCTYYYRMWRWGALPRSHEERKCNASPACMHLLLRALSRHRYIGERHR